MGPAQHDLIGFSVCFSQLIPSLLAAREIKKHAPGVPIVLGGSTCAPRIGASLLNVFRQIDFIITGEGEQALLDLCDYLMEGRENPGPNALYRQDETIHIPDPERDSGEIDEFNQLPPPDYSDYFQELRAQKLSFIPELPVEFSRGCWWNKCAFCNLNLQWRGYRYKSGERMIKEVEFLQKRHQALDFS